MPTHSNYLDFHTHTSGCERYINHPDVTVIQSLHLDESPHPRADFATIGIHPMLQGSTEMVRAIQTDYDTTVNRWIGKINSSTTPIIAIGECGWDKRSPLSTQEQELLVDFQITLGETLQKPIIFHIVGAWHLLLAKTKERTHASTPWIVHGFRGKPELAQQLLQAGIQLSLHPLSPTPPTTDYFLETDDTDKTIQECYRERGLDTALHKRRVINLFCNLFPPISH